MSGFRRLVDVDGVRVRPCFPEEATLIIRSWNPFMMSGEETIKELLKRNSRIILAVLLMPAVGMIIAMILIAVRGASNILTIYSIIGVVLAQYLLLVAYIWRKVFS